MQLPISIYQGLQSIGSKSSTLLSMIETKIPSALETSTNTSKLIAYRKMLEADLDTKLPRSVLRIRTPDNPYGKMQ